MDKVYMLASMHGIEPTLYRTSDTARAAIAALRRHSAYRDLSEFYIVEVAQDRGNPAHVTVTPFDVVFNIGLSQTERTQLDALLK